jgi:glycosyltransferase involved in cell wall biosynthesis
VRVKFLIVSTEIIDTKLAGPGMRYLEMARTLRDDVDVTLALPGSTSLSEPGISLARYSDARPTDFRKLLEAHDVVLVTAFTLNKFPFLSQVQTRFVIDLYDPFIFENFYYYLDEPLAIQTDINSQAVNLLNQVARLGDFFICGSERQRDLWIGLLVANGRINPHTFEQDDSLRLLIDVVGIGFPDREPVQNSFLRGIHPGFPEECRIVLWGGGVWDWLDPITLLRAWPQIIEHRPEARMVFLGTRAPNPDVPQHRVVPKLETLADSIGEKDRTVFFLEWLSYADREALLSEADIGVIMHALHIETHFSIRTRVLDYIWSRLPILISEGDVTSQWVREYALGNVVPPGNPDAVAQGLLDLLSQPKDIWKSAFDVVRDRFKWLEVVHPLRRYLLKGDYAADHLVLGRGPGRQKTSSQIIWRSRWARARYIIRTQGFQALLVKIIKKIWSY